MAKVILIIEDEPKNLKLVRDLLQVSGYMTLEATNGETGITLANEKKPDLILMDIQLPIMDGIEATINLKKNKETEKIPIIALTAYAMVSDKKKILQAGCDGLLVKPIDIRELLKKVNEFCLEQNNK